MKYTITITLRERERNRLLRIMRRKRMDRTALDCLGALVSRGLQRNLEAMNDRTTSEKT